MTMRARLTMGTALCAALLIATPERAAADASSQGFSTPVVPPAPPPVIPWAGPGEPEAGVQSQAPHARARADRDAVRLAIDRLGEAAAEARRRLDAAAERMGRRLEQAGAQARQPGRPRDEAMERRREALRRRQDALRQRRESRRQGPGVTESVTRTFRLGRSGVLDLSNASGDVTITGGGGDEVRLEATKRVWHPEDATARAQLSAIQVDAVERSGRLEVRTQWPRDGARALNGAVDYVLTVPAGTAVSVTAVAGTVRISRVSGEVRADTVSGDLRISDAGHVRALKTVSGDVELEGVQGDDLVASTVGGSVTARRLKARTLDVRVVGGDLRLVDVDSERVRAQSLSGAIVYDGRLAPAGRYELQAHAGGIEVTPRDGTGFEVEARTFSGSLRSDYPLTLSGRGRGRDNRRLIVGTFGNGGALLALRSFSGDIAILKP